MSKTLTFNQAVGRSVPGGPFRLGKTYVVDDVTLKHPLISALMDNGKVISISSKAKDAIDARVEEKNVAPARVGRPPKASAIAEAQKAVAETIASAEAESKEGVDHADASE